MLSKQLYCQETSKNGWEPEFGLPGTPIIALAFKCHSSGLWERGASLPFAFLEGLKEELKIESYLLPYAHTSLPPCSVSLCREHEVLNMPFILSLSCRNLPPAWVLDDAQVVKLVSEPLKIFRKLLFPMKFFSIPHRLLMTHLRAFLLGPCVVIKCSFLFSFLISNQ